MYREKGNSKADTLVKVVLVFFISLLSFSVGTFIGKQVSDSDHRRMALETDVKADRQVASTESNTDAKMSSAIDKMTDKISDKEVESLTEEFVNKEKGDKDNPSANQVAENTAFDKDKDKDKDKNKEKDMDRSDAAQASAGHTGYKNYSRSKKMEPAKNVAEKVADGEAPSDGEVEKRKPASSALPGVASSAIGKYTVQVASYPDEKQAMSRAAELKGKGMTAFYFPASIQGRTWFRVSVGLFENYKGANEYRGQYIKESGSKAAIVQKIVQ